MSDVDILAGRKLREGRTQMRLSQNNIGESIGVTSQQVQKYEAGRNAMTASRIYQFAKVLNVEPAFFFEDTKQNQGKKTFVKEGEISASDRENIEVLRSFKRIKNRVLRKRIADFLRTLSEEDI